MNPSLPKLKGVREGSNLHGRALSKTRTAQLAEVRSAYARPVDEFSRRARKLFSRSDLKAASGIIARLRSEYHASNLQLGPDAAKWEANRVAFQKKLRRQLAHALPKVREWQGLVRAMKREHQRLTRTHVTRRIPGSLEISIGELPPLTGDGEEFAPPYPLYDVSIDDETNFPDVEDQSFAIPGIGHVINNVSLEYDDDTSILNGIFGLYLPIWGWSRSGCGVNYTVPSQGRLRICAALRSFHTRVTLSLEDNFGFSMGRVYSDASLYVEIVRGRNITHLSQTLVQKTLESDGDDVQASLPTLDDTAPYLLDVTTDEVFTAGAAVQIIAGSELNAGCLLDDMKAHVDGLLWSQIQKITVDVV